MQLCGIAYIGISILLVQVGIASPTEDESHFFDVTKDVQILASPSSVYDPMTGDLTLNCTFSKSEDSDVETIIALILSKLDQPSQKFQELAAVSSHTKDEVHIKDTMGADVTGHIASTSSSFIALKWSIPRNDIAGKFYCEAHGLDGNGFPRISTANLEVVAQKIDNSMLLQLIHDMKKSQQDLKEELSATKGTMKSMKAELDSCKKQNPNIEVKLQDLTSQSSDILLNMNNPLSSLPVASETYQGHTYYVSGRVVQNAPFLQSVCVLYGGYLAEINGDGEYKVLYEFLLDRLEIDEYILLGATDEGHEGNWTWMSSGRPMDYVNWIGVEPNGGTHCNCLYLSKKYTGLIDDTCIRNGAFARILCEIES